MKKTALILAKLILGFCVVVLVVSLAAGVSPVKLFDRLKDSNTLNLLYVALLYIMIILVVHLQSKQDKIGGIFNLGLSPEKFKFRRELFLGLSSFCLFLFYLFFVKQSGAAYIRFNKSFLPVLARGFFFGFLFSFIEEVLFRGYIFQEILKEKSAPTAFIIANALFAAVHVFRSGEIYFKILYFLGLFGLGLLLSYAFYRTRSLWSCIFIHTSLIAGMYLFANNFGINQEIYNANKLFWGLEKTPVAGVGSFLLIAFFAIWIKATTVKRQA